MDKELVRLVPARLLKHSGGRPLRDIVGAVLDTQSLKRLSIHSGRAREAAFPVITYVRPADEAHTQRPTPALQQLRAALPNFAVICTMDSVGGSKCLRPHEHWGLGFRV